MAGLVQERSSRARPVSLVTRRRSGPPSQPWLGPDIGMELDASKAGPVVRFLVRVAWCVALQGGWAFPVAGDRKPYPVLTQKFNDYRARFSPDGHWISYTSNETGRQEIYVQTFPKATGKWQVSSAGGADASWRADGKELIYRAPDQRLMSVEVRNGENFQMSVPRALFLPRLVVANAARNRYVAAPDGQRFLLVSPPGRSAMAPTTVVLNWSAELKR